MVCKHFGGHTSALACGSAHTFGEFKTEGLKLAPTWPSREEPKPLENKFTSTRLISLH